ncbi:pyridoxal phosphate-dependent transferase [Mycena rebaudengoi]|nr:pyridoxal phosphate-dependent transferase [Mycena rebaudengoi]
MSALLSLSDRALRRISLPPPHAYMPPPGAFYDPELYPEGIINLSIAENSLLSDRLLGYLSQPITLHTQHLRYRATLLKSTLPTVEDLLPQYINDHFKPRLQVSRENSVSGPGLGALIAQLTWALVGEGEGVLMSNPFYDDYVRDVVHPAISVLVSPGIPRGVDTLSVDVLPVLFLCNPHNPIPQIASEELVKGYALLAQKYDIHLVVDEVYGMTTFTSYRYPPANPTRFRSILTYDLAAMGVDPWRVHVLCGPTKDFGASGLKLGLLVSQGNPDLLKLLRPLFYATPISSVSDALFSRVLQDKTFVKEFLADNSIALRDAYEFAAGLADVP